MGYGTNVNVQLRRAGAGVSWGFRLQGGKDFSSPLSVQRVFNGSPSDGQLQRGDVIVAVDNRDVRQARQDEAQDLIQHASLTLNLAIERSAGVIQDTVYTSAANFTSNTSYQPQFQEPVGGMSQTKSAQSYPWSAHPAPPTQSADSRYNNYPPDNHPTDNYPKDNYPKDNYPTDNYPKDNYPTDHRAQGSSPRAGGQQQYKDFSEPQSGDWGQQTKVNVQRPHEETEEGYEQKTVGSIKQMFNKDDPRAQHATTSGIRLGHPRAPMHTPYNEPSFSMPNYAEPPSHAKSSLTPSRPGAIQRGAPDNRPSTYIPNLPRDQTKKIPSLYGYSQDQAPCRYTGGFVGINALLKDKPSTLPVKKPSAPKGQKKEFDPTQSSVLRVLQQEQDTRGGSHTAERSNNYPDDSQMRHHRGPQEHKMSKGQQWQQEQQQQQVHNRQGPSKQGSSLLALLEKDQQSNPQEDPVVQHDPHAAARFGSGPPTQSEYRRPGTAYKPSENKAKPSVNLDDYPLHVNTSKAYDYAPPGYAPPPDSAYTSDTYRSVASFQPQTGNARPQADYPQAGKGFSPSYHQSPPQQFDQGFPYAKFSSYPASGYSAGGIPACDF